MTQAGSKLVSRHLDILSCQAGFQTATVEPCFILIWVLGVHVHYFLP